MDYFWVDHEGKGWGYLNTGKGKNQWYGLGPIATTGGQERRKIRMAVLTKSGRADYVVVDDEDGAAEWWQNLGSSHDYNWAHRGVAAKGPKNTLENLFGWKFKGQNVRFAEYVNPTPNLTNPRIKHMTWLTRACYLAWMATASTTTSTFMKRARLLGSRIPAWPIRTTTQNGALRTWLRTESASPLETFNLLIPTVTVLSTM